MDGLLVCLKECLLFLVELHSRGSAFVFEFLSAVYITFETLRSGLFFINHPCLYRVSLFSLVCKRCEFCKGSVRHGNVHSQYNELWLSTALLKKDKSVFLHARPLVEGSLAVPISHSTLSHAWLAVSELKKCKIHRQSSVQFFS